MAGCSKCGTALKPGAAFCGQCGHRALQQGSAPLPTPPVVPSVDAPHLPGKRGFVLVGLISGAAATLCQEWIAGTLDVKSPAGLIRFLPFVVSLISSFRSSRRSMQRSA